MPQTIVSPDPQSNEALKVEISAAEFRVFNRLAEQMSAFHTILRLKWDELYASTDPKANKPAPSQVVHLGLHSCQHLKGHHDIEEKYWFPVLGRKMEGFRSCHFATSQHKEIHMGLDKLLPYLMSCKQKTRPFHRVEVREILDSFGGVLWKHLDDEVSELGAENMRKHWTKEDMLWMPF